MDSFVLKTGVQKIAIYESETDKEEGIEPRGIFKFNPNDVTEARKILELQADFITEQETYVEKEKACTTELEKMRVMEELATKYREKLDYIYGPGTSVALFGNALTYEMFVQFFEFITVKYKEFSEKRVSKKLEELQ